jgi:hypothetical protein
MQFLEPDGAHYAALAPAERLVATWQAGELSASRFIDAGEKAQEATRFDDALEWYRRALRITPGSEVGWYHVASLYQARFKHDPTKLDQFDDAYQEYTAWNNGNWIVNGGFSEGQLGWSRYRPSGRNAVFEIVASSPAVDASTGHVLGRSEEYHGGWWQQLGLEEGRLYRYSCDLRTEESHNLEVRALYWESYVDGRPLGSYAEVITGSIDWTHFEVDLQVPASERGLVLYPMLVKGQGGVWVDNVRLVELEAPSLEGTE